VIVEPASQFSQLSPPEPLWYWRPTLQSEHAVAPLHIEYVPGPHVAHAESVVAAVPARHWVHSEAPAALTDPAGQSLQSSPAALYLPAGQSPHVVAAPFAFDFPAGQSSHVLSAMPSHAPVSFLPAPHVEMQVAHPHCVMYLFAGHLAH